jgi:hypothetical protein
MNFQSKTLIQCGRCHHGKWVEDPICKSCVRYGYLRTVYPKKYKKTVKIKDLKRTSKKTTKDTIRQEALPNKCLICGKELVSYRYAYCSDKCRKQVYGTKKQIEKILKNLDF